LRHTQGRPRCARKRRRLVFLNRIPRQKGRYSSILRLEKNKSAAGSLIYSTKWRSRSQRTLSSFRRFKTSSVRFNLKRAAPDGLEIRYSGGCGIFPLHLRNVIDECASVHAGRFRAQCICAPSGNPGKAQPRRPSPIDVVVQAICLYEVPSGIKGQAPDADTSSIRQLLSVREPPHGWTGVSPCLKSAAGPSLYYPALTPPDSEMPG